MNSLFRWPIALAIVGTMVAGCASTAQIAQRYDDRCAERGLQSGTNAFRDCVAQLENESALRRDARHREMVERSAVPSFGR
jgi:hypothetical protein